MDKRIFTIVKKELKRVFSDKRLVFTTMILPALSIFIMYSIIGSIIEVKTEDINSNIPRVILINSPDSFNEFVEKNELKNKYEFTYKDDSKKEESKSFIQKGEFEVLIYFEKNFDDKIASFSKPNIERYYNRSGDYSLKAKYRIDEILIDYENSLLGVRLGNPDHVIVFELNKYIENDNLEDSKKATGKTLSILFPMLIAIFLFTGAMSIGADMIAGEKERGTMATLLVTPVRRETLAVGKLISLAIIALVSSLSSFIGVVASMPMAGSLFSSNGVDISSLRFSAYEYFSLIIIMLSLVGLYVAIICTISVISKSIKEANSYMSPIYMIVMISGFMTMSADGVLESWRFLIPIYGSVIALKNLFMFELTTKMLFYNTITSAVITVILVYVIKILFNNEKVMFNK